MSNIRNNKHKKNVHIYVQNSLKNINKNLILLSFYWFLSLRCITNVMLSKNIYDYNEQLTTDVHKNIE